MSAWPIRTHASHDTSRCRAADARTLRAGDQVVIDGEIVITAGMPTHERLLGCLDGAEPLPMDLQGASLFHLGSYSREADGRFELLYLNPTTSTRFNPFMPRLIEASSWHAVGGKGGPRRGLRRRRCRRSAASTSRFSAAAARCCRRRSAKWSRSAGATC